MNTAEILQGCQLFRRIEGPGFQRLVAMARLSRFDKGDIIFRENQECPGVYVVGTGLVRIFKIAANGKEHVLHLVGPGNTFAEVAAIGGFNCPANAEAVAPSVCVLLPLAPFARLLAEDHSVCMQMMLGLTCGSGIWWSCWAMWFCATPSAGLARYLVDADADAAGFVNCPHSSGTWPAT